MHFFFGAPSADENKITNQFNEQAKLTLKSQFCQFCNKLPATKVAFVPQIKRGFTCNNCELTAVGNDLKNLGQKSLMPNQKLTQTITKALINYQTIQSQSPQVAKQLQNEVKSHIKVSQQSIQKIKTQFKLLRSTTENKVQQLIKSSEQQNSNILFEELNKKSKQKKQQSSQLISLICKKSLINKKGLHFIDDQAIETANNHIDQRLTNLKSQIKIKLKQIDDLAEWINKIQI